MRLVVFAMYCDTPTMEWDYLKCYNFIYTTMQQWKNLHSFQLLAVLTLRRKQRKNMFLFSLFLVFFSADNCISKCLEFTNMDESKNVGAQACA